MDFSIKKYQDLLESLLEKGYSFQSFDSFLRNAGLKAVILRHDVDLRPEHSLMFAKLQHALGIFGVYYFRAVSKSWNNRIIQEVAGLGHEIGYHYECLTTCKGNLPLAIQDFEKNLTALRRLVPVSTICMHGSPMSRFDSKDLWKTYNYGNFGIIGEPYFDIDFKKILYLTDTGRRWDGDKVSVRDKVNSGYNLIFRNTDDIISAVHKGTLPDQVMFTFHPQRWNDNSLLWASELVSQNIKNLVKRHFFIVTV